METKKREKPCCAAEALRRIRRIEVGEVVVGLAMLDDVLADVIKRGIAGVTVIGDELARQIKIYNYIPKEAEPLYRAALLLAYQNEVKKR
ncbi:MAG: hypothetical protein XE10_1492 [Methanoculleus marisnigri]|jgi:hypothetical protein|uniref:Uncharacterized protein n=1 Tax=Methanoculleus marisnigri TaxID=2198 RepID=A0A101GN57_9EURY|nr:hypothetical protein [Methanoculleus marisnigri]KUK61401.1 MAG: hypothetical protein XD82_1130 [Methanoculleus marisnigri]KUL00253.1 MAG: hypothetical protein XE10_1492 [Methanoculleus marisnigri]